MKWVLKISLELIYVDYACIVLYASSIFDLRAFLCSGSVGLDCTLTLTATCVAEQARDTCEGVCSGQSIRYGRAYVGTGSR